MTSRRPTASGRPEPIRPRSLLPLLVLIALVAAACIGGETVAPSASIASVAPSSPSAEPSTSSSPSLVAPSPTATPLESPSEEPSLEPSESPTGEGSVQDCAGNDDNRTFYEGAAEDLGWPLYCPALPDGWFVTEGTYRSTGIGWLQITYRGPGGATLSLHQGAFCDDGDGCVAAGTPSGDAPFGDQAGTLIALDDGRFALVVDRGQSPSWLAIGTDLDEASFREMTADFIRLD